MSGWFYKVAYPCEQAREFMYDYLDGQLPMFKQFRFQIHLNGCTECREYYLLYKKAAHAYEFRKENPPPSEFLEHTLDFLRKEGIVGDDDPATAPESNPVVQS